MVVTTCRTLWQQQRRVPCDQDHPCVSSASETGFEVSFCVDGQFDSFDKHCCYDRHNCLGHQRARHICGKCIDDTEFAWCTNVFCYLCHRWDLAGYSMSSSWINVKRTLHCQIGTCRENCANCGRGLGNYTSHWCWSCCLFGMWVVGRCQEIRRTSKLLLPFCTYLPTSFISVRNQSTS